MLRTLHGADKDFTRFLWLSGSTNPESNLNCLPFQSGAVWLCEFTLYVECT